MAFKTFKEMTLKEKTKEVIFWSWAITALPFVYSVLYTAEKYEDFKFWWLKRYYTKRGIKFVVCHGKSSKYIVRM